MLIITGMIGGIVGGTIVRRTDKQVTELKQLYEKDRQEFVQIEGKRMQTVYDSFKYHKAAYFLAIVAAAILLLLVKSPYWQGFAVGLLLFAAMGFTIDFYAEEGAKIYLEAINNLI